MAIPWIEVFAVLLVCHLVGDFILQTEFQAINKPGGLSGGGTARRALAQHTLSYTLAHVPLLVWLAGDLPAAGLVLVVLAIGVPHGLQDDGRAVRWWMRTVKRTPVAPGVLAILVDQSFHVVALLLLALAVGA